MPSLRLPDNPDLEHLKGQARAFQCRVRDGDPQAVAAVLEHHPRADGIPAGAAFRLADAQLVVARQYGFISWPQLHKHVDAVRRYARAPHRQPTGEADADPVDDFLRLACLVYGGDHADRRNQARALLEAHPELATANIFTMAAVADVDSARPLLDQDGSAASRPGGPFAWEPLLYLTYSRIELEGSERLDPISRRSDPVAFARLLLDHGANPNAGYLWEGLIPPFTALTGAFGRGEDSVNQPPHRDEYALARVLLEAGADPNDNQTLYNRHFEPDNGHLELLFEFGLGEGSGGPWAARFETASPTPQQMLEDQLTWAARRNYSERVRLLLEHGVDPDGRGTRHPVVGSASAYEIAYRRGSREIVALLEAAGAAAVAVDPVAEVVAAALAGDAAEVAKWRHRDPSLVTDAIDRWPSAVLEATELRRPRAVQLLADLGFDVSARRRITALHQAAYDGDIEMVRLLLGLGADPNVRDESYDATPLDWARHLGREEVGELLSDVTEPDEPDESDEPHRAHEADD